MPRDMISKVTRDDLRLLASQNKSSFTGERNVKALKSSSQDEDQNIYATLTDNEKTFWCSAPSDTAESSEYLIYELPARQRVIDVMIKVYDFE